MQPLDQKNMFNEVVGIDVEIRGRPAGLHSRTKPRGQDEKEAMTRTRDTIQDKPWRDHFGSVRGGRSGGRGEIGMTRKTLGQEDGREKGEGGNGDGDVPSRRISPLTLLPYKGGYPSRWPQGRSVFFCFLFGRSRFGSGPFGSQGILIT